MALPIIDPKQFVPTWPPAGSRALVSQRRIKRRSRQAVGQEAQARAAPRQPAHPSEQQAFAPLDRPNELQLAKSVAPQIPAARRAAGGKRAAQPAAPMGFLDRMANLPLIYLVLIGIVWRWPAPA